MAEWESNGVANNFRLNCTDLHIVEVVVPISAEMKPQAPIWGDWGSTYRL